MLQAQHAGAVAVIVANDHVEPEPCGGGRTSRCQLVAMGTSDGDLAETVSIPSVFVSKVHLTPTPDASPRTPKPNPDPLTP